jgi:hypothetical protein
VVRDVAAMVVRRSNGRARVVQVSRAAAAPIEISARATRFWAGSRRASALRTATVAAIPNTGGAIDVTNDILGD